MPKMTALEIQRYIRYHPEWSEAQKENAYHLYFAYIRELGETPACEFPFNPDKQMRLRVQKEELAALGIYV